jgi:ABC-type phosphate transport system substrate-binding protein
MKKAIIILASVMFLVSCGGSDSSSTSIDTVVGTYDGTDTLQPIFDSVAHIQDSTQESTEVYPSGGTLGGFKKAEEVGGFKK